MEILRLIQDTSFAVWIRESSWALFFLLIVHTLAMGFLVGTGAAISLRVLGFVQRAPLSRFSSFLPVMGWAAVFAVISGVGLVMAYPAKALTNPLFYVKLTIIVAAAALTLTLARKLFPDARYQGTPGPSWSRGVAALALLLWVVTIPAGKFLAYTHKVLLVY